jgi:hypothetical protein
MHAGLFYVAGKPRRHSGIKRPDGATQARQLERRGLHVAARPLQQHRLEEKASKNKALAALPASIPGGNCAAIRMRAQARKCLIPAASCMTLHRT